MLYKRTSPILNKLSITGLLLLAGCGSEKTVQPDPPDTLPEFQITQFTQPAVCGGCHPNHFNEWRGSMHAYAFVDPVFFAMHERGQQLTGGKLDQFCVRCHSPIASRSGETPPFFDRGTLSSISKQGVQCDLCHSISNIDEISNANFSMKPGNVKFGSLPDPVPNSFHQSQFNSLFDRSALCGTCHEVINPLGTRVEETYTEWASASLAGMSFDCQDCHMPTYSGQAATNGPQRDKLHRHTFVGVDVPLIDFPNADEQRKLSEELLQNAALFTVNAPDTVAAGDTARIEVRIDNTKTGHNLPSGVAAERQMWIAIEIRAANGDLIYETGQLDANLDLMDHHSVTNPNGDPDLVVFRQTLFGENGEEVLFFFEAASFKNNVIPVFDFRTAQYKFTVPSSNAGPLHLNAALRFRSLPPYFLRELDLEHLVAKVPIVDMANESVNIIIE